MFATVCAMAAALPPRAAAAETHALPAGIRELVTTPAKLEAFARPLASEVEHRLAAAPAAGDGQTGLLLGLRVHLALLLGDHGRALDTAARIRVRQTGDSERAYAGLVTEATVAARREGNRTGAEFAAEFGDEFARRLATLPRSPEATALLAQQRDRIRGMTRDALLAEATLLGAKIDGTRRCTLEEADHIVRIGHRLRNVVPLRETMLAVFDAEIAARRPQP